VECKQRCGSAIADHLAPLRERRRQYDRQPDRLWEILRAGEERARLEARETMGQVRAAMGLG
jgi:tryptophanyl-tRNA synthetase